MIWAVAALRPVDDRPAPNRSAAMRALSASPLCSPCVSDSVIRLDGRLERSNDQRGFGPRKGSRTGGAVSTARSFRFPHIRDNTLVGKDACRPGQSRERRIRNVGIVARRPGSGPRSALYRGIPGGHRAHLRCLAVEPGPGDRRHLPRPLRRPPDRHLTARACPPPERIELRRTRG